MKLIPFTCATCHKRNRFDPKTVRQTQNLIEQASAPKQPVVNYLPTCEYCGTRNTVPAEKTKMPSMKSKARRNGKHHLPVKIKLKVVIHEAEEGGYWAEVPGFPGCVSQGDTLDEVRANIKEAFEGVFEAMQDDLPSQPGKVEEIEL